MIQSLYKNFQHWSARGSVYIFSDPHFEDFDCKLMNPNWLSPQEHIDKLKAKAHKNDTLICLGDVGNPEWFNQLKCYKVLIKGNHDAGSANYINYFNEVYEGPLFISDKILLSHEPIEGLNFCLNIHGHVHNGAHKSDSYHLNVASDVIDYNVISLGELIKSGAVANIQSIHREVIDRATARKERKKE